MLGENLDNAMIVPLACSSRKYAYYDTEIINAYKNPSDSIIYGGVSRSDVIQTLNANNGYVQDGSYYVKTYADDFTYAAKFKIIYERSVEKKGSFYSTITSGLSDTSGNAYAISLSKDGRDGNFDSYPDGIAGVKLRKVSSTPAADQQWYFQALSDGSYAIRNLANGYYLYKDGSSLRAKADFTRANTQKWYIVLETNGGYSLSNKSDFSTAIRTTKATITGDEHGLQFSTPDQSASQIWTLDINNTTSPAWGEDLGDTFYAYVSLASDSSKYLKSGNAVSGDDSIIKFVQPANETAKRKQEYFWKFERQDDGSYAIMSCTLSNALLHKSGSDEGFNHNGTIVIRSGSTGIKDDYLYGRRWYIRKYANGYQIESKRDGRVLTLQSDDYLIAQTPTADKTNQLFNITKNDMTVSSEMPYVKMRLFNYGRAINSAENAVLPFFNGSTDKRDYVDNVENDESYLMSDKSPIMSNTLVNGYPYVINNDIKSSDAGKGGNVDNFVGKSGSLKYLFDDSKSFVAGEGSATSYKLPSSNYISDSDYQSQCFTVNNPSSLFKKNDKNGLYYYDSLLNAAYFQRDTDSTGKQLTTGNFNLYDYTLTPSAADYKSDTSTVTGISANNGNFFPFNLGHEEGTVSYGTGNRPTISVDTNDYVTNGDYAPVNYTLDGNTPIDCWFGMTLENTFVQTEGGTFNGQPLQFSFKGDDDVWIYVDGILVLDIGGTHGAKEGIINFKSGVVTDPTGATKTLKSLYQAIVNENVTKGTTYTFNGTVIDQNYIDNNFDGDTFKADTKHTLNFYYMERGGSISYCQLKFNLPKGSIGVSKKVEGLDPDLKDPREYTFQLQGADGKPFTSTLSGLTEIAYLYEKADGTTEERTMPIGGNNDCKFKLKDGELITFQDIPNGEKYKVVELDVPSGMKSTATIAKGDSAAVSYNPDAATSVQSNIFSQITYRNTLEKTENLSVVKKVLSTNNSELTEMPNATYSMGLHIFDKDQDGNIINDYGTKMIEIQGEDVGIRNLYSGLPAGASYELWEYVPVDNENRYDAPMFTDSDENGTKGYIARLVETSSTPALNDVISGTVSGQTITVVNKILDPNAISVTFKYYDRETVSGKPATINDKETTYSKTISLTDTVYADYVDEEYNIITGKGRELLRTIISNVSSEAGADKIGNRVDEYELFTSQKEAVNYITANPDEFHYTIGDVDNYATHYITKSEAVYHTNSQRQPIINTSEQEEWVTYYKSGEAVDAESDSFIDFDEITNITVWLYNRPKTYTVRTHVPDGIGNANGKEITYKALYNQQLGVNADNNLKECYAYCKQYSIPLEDYNTVGKYGNEIYTDSGALETFGNEDFSCWTDEANGRGNILSTNQSYLYRVTGNLDLYANYGDEVGKGVVSTDGGIEVYYDSSGTRRLRINTVMNPYGFALGKDSGNPNIQYASAAYLVLKDPDASLTDTQIATIKENIKTTAQNIVDRGMNNNVYPKKGSASFEVENVGQVTVVVYEVRESKLLTNKNRLNFMAGYKSPTGDDKKTVLAFTSLYYNDGKAASSDNGWYISNNYITNTMTSNTGT